MADKSEIVSRTSMWAKCVFLGSAMLAGPAMLSAQAWDGEVTGRIKIIGVTGGQNYDFRVTLEGLPKMCTGGLDFAYLNEVDSNYKTYVALLMLARAQNAKVTIYSRLQNGQCHIGYAQLSDE